MVIDLADVFSSKSKFKVLKLLIQYREPIPLRTISSLVELPIRSVVLALESLLQQEIVEDMRMNNNRLFRMNQNHLFCDELKNIFSAVEESEIKIRSKSYKNEATRALKFAQSATKFFSET
jgi:DNA-binding transcriptional ArsR family regulator